MQNSYSVATVKTSRDAAAVELESIEAGGDLFSALDLSLLRGRLPSPAERHRGDPVVILSQRAATALWPDGAAVGRSVYRGNRSEAETVIGIVAEATFAGLARSSRRDGQIFHLGLTRRTSTFVISSTRPVRDALGDARRILEDLGDIEVTRAVTMREAMADSVLDYRLRAWLYGGLAASALAIVATAMFGLVATNTNARTREFGIRRALGATGEGLVTMVVCEQGATVMTGLALGATLAYWALGLIRGAAVGLAPTDARLWAIAAGTIVATAIAGAMVPALRSARVDPTVTLRGD